MLDHDIDNCHDQHYEYDGHHDQHHRHNDKYDRNYDQHYRHYDEYNGNDQHNGDHGDNWRDVHNRRGSNSVELCVSIECQRQYHSGLFCECGAADASGPAGVDAEWQSGGHCGGFQWKAAVRSHSRGSDICLHDCG